MPSRSIAASAPFPFPEKLFTVSSFSPAPLVSKGYNDGHSVRRTRVLNPLMAAGAGVGFSFFITLSVCFCKFSRKRPSPTPGDVSSSPRRFSYSSLSRATGSFSPNNRLGQGGFGAVFRGSVSPLTSSGSKDIAVKVMDSGSLQGEREFQNELFFAAKLDSPHVVPVLGFSQDRKRRRLLLVYELMDNGNLQDALLHRKCPELMEWNQRFLVAINIAEGIEHLHNLEPPVIHGDIKPSNVLLDKLFSAKISDFGLARLKSDQVEIVVAPESTELKLQGHGGRGGVEDNGSVVEEVESIVTNTTGYEEFNFGFVDQSPGSISASPETALAPMTSPETTTTTALSVSPELGEKADVLDDIVRRNGKEMETIRSKDWWWKQESNNGEIGKVKNDYVMQWIGSEVNKERPSSDWTETVTTSSISSKKLEKKSSKRLEWWLSLEEEKEKTKKKKKKRMVREWWKDEYRRELAKKKKEKKKNTLESEFHNDDWSSSVNQWQHGDEELYTEKKRNRKKRSGSSNNSKGSSIDWWLDGLSGERWKTKGNESVSGEIGKSCGVSSTPSMRGTVCYAAPEFCNLEDVSEKCDVYSYGVLLLVLVSGRRPLEMTGSASEIQRANLMSWAKKLGRRGKLVDLIDEKLLNLDEEQALLCIKVALQCLQRVPGARPSMKEVVGMLRGEVSSSEFPSEFSPASMARLGMRRKQRC